ncbi:polyketide synthase [Rathayibacter rathayi]|uniref:Polyketide synthase n=1 Tax=Rathayibacter rathayi TaxID=33887 RepID=A0ABD6W756_RATRA|nr:acyl carrier protein [Rathayibacter rathayi]AZZ48221.1 polyketide synthase [Rathayibacter rathayi]MWV75505.1 acyl carrier protein [Rathayibacter rathayi NCPPB 2980 = VKM Ac-1601]PPF13012.1 polyketide synthase [Rathayibacter rathayi]PPF19075.1 polyketide synthase [Rathayibacter rathayi]PPF48088.1 polyketide synthase [Rathayibacter rathayi]
MTDAITTNITADALEEWLIDRVATYGEISPSSFTVTTSLAELGFNSVYALTLCGDIEDAFDIDVEPSLIWDHSNISALAETLCRQLAL